ncbi:MAG: hypothetical protein PUH26_02595 [Oscillospiraceae bacterium]|nr:hypothetical protein [Oscillospiraceae bacterium]MDY5580949.1 hypothetical protein [Oscillospiraceae bacterium]
MRCKILKTIQKVCDIQELLVAVLVAAGLICSLILYLPVGLELLLKSGNTAEFLIFLEDMFSLVVGIEFIKMLCRPSADNVIEVLIFLTARHMIVGGSSSLDIFLSVLSVALLYGVRYGLRLMKRRTGKGGEETPPEKLNSDTKKAETE